MADFDPDKYLEKKKKSEPFDPDKYLASKRPESALQTFGRSSASLADTALNALTGTLDYAAYPLARAFGRSPEQAQQETTSPKDVVGRMFNVTGTPGYENAPLRSIGRNVGETISENVVQPIASATGLPEQDVGSMLGSATMGVAPVVPKVASATVSAGQKALPIVKAPIDIGKGLYQGVKGVEPGSQKSAVVPLRETYYPPEMVNAYMRGDIDLATLQAGQQPSKSLFATPEQQSALRNAEKMPGEPNVPLIPVRGKGMQAFGERVGREYVTDPYRAAADIGLSIVAGVPLPLSAAQRALQARQSRTLSQAANFDPAFRQKLLQDTNQPMPVPQTATMPAPGPVAPPNYPMTVAGPNQQLPPSVIPMPGPQRNVRVEGQSYTLPNQIDTSQVQTARAPQSATPVPDLAQLAAQRSVQEAAKSANQVRQTAAQQVQAAPSQSMFAGKPSTTPPATVPAQSKTTPARDSKTIRKEIDMLDRRNDELFQNTMYERDAFNAQELQAMRNELNGILPKINTLQNELTQALKKEKSQSRKSQKIPKNTSQMMVDDDVARTFNALKSAGESPLEQQIAGMTQVNRDRLEQNIRQAAKPGDPMIQEYLSLFEKYRIK